MTENTDADAAAPADIEVHQRRGVAVDHGPHPNNCPLTRGAAVLEPTRTTVGPGVTATEGGKLEERLKRGTTLI